MSKRRFKRLEQRVEQHADFLVAEVNDLRARICDIENEKPASETRKAKAIYDALVTAHVSRAVAAEREACALICLGLTGGYAVGGAQAAHLIRERSNGGAL